MPLYTFYPTRNDGLSNTFESQEFSSDQDATSHARQVLLAHDSAASVIVFCENRKVSTRARTYADARSDPMNLSSAQVTQDAASQGVTPG